MDPVEQAERYYAGLDAADDEAMVASEAQALREALEEGRFGHHIKGNPRDGEWRCTCGYGDEEDHYDSAEEHIGKLAFEAGRRFENRSVQR